MASAKQIRDEIMRMTIVVNSNPAQQEIYKLTEANRKFTDESKKLRDERVKVGQTLGKNSQEYKDLTDKINGNSTSITENNRKIKDLANTLDISQMSVKQLKQEAILLRKELDRVVPGSNQYNALQTQLGAVNGRLAEVRHGAAATSSSFGDLAQKFNHYSGIITAGVALFVGFGVSIQSVIERNNKLVDAQTAVAKTVNMTKQEVDELTKSFATFDTRTSRIDLLKIAETGGRLGIGKEQIKEFTREVDKANVALGDGFAGGVESVTNTLGKLKNLYRETKDLDMATAINQIGSAMNELGAAGAASEQNIGEFALRLGSLPDKLKPTIAQSLALGAAFEESGIDAQRAGTAYSTFVRTAASNAEGFAKVMGKTKQEVEELINKDPMEFFLKFSEGAKGLDTTELAKMLEYLKLNDQYVISTMGSASENTERFRKSIELSNKSLTEATSLTDEFNKVNNNTSAIFDKVQKKFLGMFTSQTVADTLNSLISTFGKFIGAIEDSSGGVTTFRNTLVFLMKVITLMIATMISYNLVTGVYNTLMKTAYERVIGLTIVEKARNAVMLISNGIATLYRATLWLLAAGYSLVTGNVLGATFAMRGFTAALMANPLGAVLVLVGLMASAYLAFTSSVKDSNKALNEQSKALDFVSNTTKRVTDEQAKSVAELKSKVEPLIKVLKDEKSQLEDRKKAYQELIKISPEFTNTLDNEFRATVKLDAAYASLIEKIKGASKARALQSILDAEYEKREKLASQKEIYSGSLENNKNDKSLYYPNGKPKAGLQLTKNLIDASNDELEILDGNIESISKKIADMKPLQTSQYLTPEGKEKNPTKPKSTEAADRRHEKEMLDAEKRGLQASELARQIQLDIEDAKIEAMAEGFEKELAALDLQEQRKLETIDKQKIAQYEFDNIDKKIAKATGDDKALFQSIKNSWIENNTDLEELKKRQAVIFEQKRKTLKVKFKNEEFKDMDEAFKKELGQLERQKNDELANFQSLEELKASLKGRMNDREIAEIKTWEEGKSALSKVYQKKEIEMQVAHMQTMLALYEGLDLSILTKEQQDQVLKFIDDAKNKVAELKAVQNSTGQTDKDKKTSKLGSKGSSDILGMSPSDWETFFSNLQDGTDALGTMQAAVGLLQNAFSAYYQYVQAGEQAQMQQVDLNAKKREKRLKAMLKTGQINQEQYEEEIQRLNDQTELKKAKLEYDAAKRKRNMDIANVISSTAMSIMNIMATAPFPVNFAMSGVAAVMGGLQLATIMRQPLPEAPGYEDGFYNMRRSQDGKQFRVQRKRLASGEVHSPTHFIAGERGTEMVIDSPTYTRFRPEVKRMLHNEISYSRGYENGYYPNNNANSSNNEEKLLMIIEQNTLAMNAIRDKKFTVYVGKTMDNAKEILDMTTEYSGYKNSSKK